MRDEAGAEGGGKVSAAQCRVLGAEAPRPGSPPQLHGDRRAHRRAGDDGLAPFSCASTLLRVNLYASTLSGT